MRIIEIHYCNECPYFETMHSHEGKDEEDLHFFDLLCVCNKTGGKVIENLGYEAFEKAMELTADIEDIDEQNKIDDKCHDDYLEKHKTTIPEWCPLKMSNDP